VAENKKNLQLISLKEVAQILGVSYGSMRRMRYHSGFPKAYRIGCQNRWSRTEIEEWALTKRTAEV